MAHSITLVACGLLYFIFTLKGVEVLANTQDLNLIRVNKCCEKFEILLDSFCTNANESRKETLQPVFTNSAGQSNIQVNFKFIIGNPACGSMPTWSIYHYPDSSDKLVLLADGKLRHYTRTVDNDDDEDDLDDDTDVDKSTLFHDYQSGQYCLEKGYSEKDEPHREFMYAKICLPEKEVRWTDTDFLLRKILNPIFHSMAMAMLLLVSIVYFILPTLRDLFGNIITTISLCLVVSQAADLVRIFTELSNHVSFFIADTILYISLQAAFFWLSSLGYYIWKTFRSRNVFLRITDGRKYCWYALCVWSSTAVMAGLAIFSHVFLDTALYKKQSIVGEQETIGWLGISIFFTPIAITILVDVIFYASTIKLINRRQVYGRIQHKLKSNFFMYALLCLIMTTSWIFMMLSWLNYDGLLYAHIIVNAVQAPLILYICIFHQKHVTFLLKKSCCYNDPQPASEWGDEMNYFNGGDY